MQTDANERFAIMSRGIQGRCLTVWAVVTTALVAAVHWLGGDVVAMRSGQELRPGFEQVLVAACSFTTIACGAWFWWVTTLTVLDLLRTTEPRPVVAAAGPVRGLALVLCGAAVTAQLAGPATAAGSQADLVAGLSLPDRASLSANLSANLSAGARASASSTARAGAAQGGTSPHSPHVVVRDGDTLWSLARDCLGPGATDAETTARWQSIHASNLREVGHDPDLIHPGQRLRLPDLHPTNQAEEQP